MTSNFEIPPLRSINDFIFDSARFQLPDFRDIEKWNNRVVKNLMYYQTNYFAFALCFLVIMFLIHPAKIISAILLIVGCLSVIIKFNIIESGSASKKKNSLSVIAGITVIVFLALYLLDALMIVSLTLLIPFCGK